MGKSYYEEICAGQDVRANLIALKAELKDEKNKRALAYKLEGNFSVFYTLLNDGDPKVRKNAALVLGEMETEDVLPFLFTAYDKEETLFVRPSYLEAMEKLDVSGYVDKLQEQLQWIDKLPQTDEKLKHLQKERQALQKLILRYNKPSHKYTGWDNREDVILITNRAQKQLLADACQTAADEVKLLGAGVRLKGADLDEVLKNRLWTEMLFPLPMSLKLQGDGHEIGRLLAGSGLDLFLDERHHGKGAWLYRLDVTGAMAPEKKTLLVRRISEALDAGSAGRFSNNLGNYELEIRLVQKKDQSFMPLLKLHTIDDHRFAYRRESIAASITPANAALIAAIAQPYLKEGAQVLDPFCGVGTMLIERDVLCKTGAMYGLDTFGEAIEKARRNTAVIGKKINYINRDFFDFTHDYSFDEIITDMPSQGKTRTRQELAEFYTDFLDRAPVILSQSAILVIYTPDPELLKAAVRQDVRYRIKEEKIINERIDTRVLILSYDRS